jgi:eukaryotic-like serine/threonine-protein kinase
MFKNFSKEKLFALIRSRFAIKLYTTLGSLVLLLVLFDKAIMPLVVRGGEVVSVPDVTGKTFEEAKKALAEKNLIAMKGYERYDTKRPLGSILFQNPFPKAQVKAGRHVYLSVNTSKTPNAPMPDLKGRTLVDVKLTLDRLGLALGSLQYAVVSKREEEGIILSQSVPAGAMLKAGTSVNLTVGQLPGGGEGEIKQSDVPDVSGKTLGEAEKMLIDAGFTRGEIIYKYSSSLLPNTVISQVIKSGELLAVGKKIGLTVSTADKSKDTSKPSSEDE